MPDYPLKFYPILKEKIWGGNKLHTILNKKSNHQNLGESWEISGVENDISIVSNGRLKGKDLNDLLKVYKEDLVGKKVYAKFGKVFPLLIKFIDAKTELSVQLHPNDQLAMTRHKSFGKTEMWYVLQADAAAEINIGFKNTIDKDTYLNHLNEGNITNLLHFEKVQKGDAFLINTGKVHAIGGGVLLAEIQQTSDITYRIYDWDRKDDQGNERELHTDLALDAIDFEVKDDFRLSYKRQTNHASNVVSNQYFSVNFLSVQGKVIRNHSNLDSFIIYMCIEGNAEISVNGHSEEITKGETLLIPSNCKLIEIKADLAELLEIYID